MAENKTKATEASVDDHVAAIGDEARRRDCETIMALMGSITNAPPRMWGPSIIGFGSYHYVYESGREGDACVVGLAVRKDDLVVYLTAAGPEQAALLEQLGRHKMGKACLYIRKLADIDLYVLDQLIRDSIAELQSRYRCTI